MKVLHVINSMDTGGAEKLLHESIPLYNVLGITTDLLLLNGYEYPFLKSLQENNKENYKIFSLGNSSVYNPLHLFKLVQFFKKYDVIHVHLFPALYWVALAKNISFSDTKLIYTEHSTNNRRRNSILFKLLDKFIYKKYNKIIAITNEVKQALENHLDIVNSNTIQVIANGVNLNKIYKAKALDKSIFFKDKEAKIIIQVARFFEPKDQATVIKSMVLLPDNVKLLLVGEGSLKKDCENLVKELNLEERVCFLGSRMDIPELLKTADFVVLSSHYEGLSLSCIEGMSSESPFIASDVPGLTEVVKDAGLLFPKNDFKALAHHINDLMNDSSYYKKITLSCLNKAKKFDINKMIENYIKLYESIR